MKQKDRFYIFGIGVLLGCVLVSLMMNRREASREMARESWSHVPAESAGADGVPALPEELAEAMRAGKVLYFEEAGDGSKVWVLGFTDSYPYVRVVEDSETGSLRYMAADQVVVELADGVDVSAMRSVARDLRVNVRMFNRRENRVVIGTVVSGAQAVPETIAALEPYADLYKSAQPDYILFRDNERQGLFF